MLRNVRTVFLKELRVTLRDKRTLFVMLVLPLLSWAGIFADPSRRWRRVGAFGGLAAGVAFAIVNSRASLLAVGCASVVFAYIVIRHASGRRAALVLLTSSVLFVVGSLGTHCAHVVLPWAQEYESRSELDRGFTSFAALLSLESLTESMRVTRACPLAGAL